MPQINNKKLSSQSPLSTGEYMRSHKYFFSSSKLFDAQITEIFDYLWPTVTALKTLRWQVNGYYHVYGVKENTELSRKFVESGDNTVRPNLFRICIDGSWEDQEKQLAKTLLVNLCACYETWCEMILQELSIPENTIQDCSKKLQSLSNCAAYVSSVCNPQSSVLTDCYYDVYKAGHFDASFGHIDNYLKVYRYYKEMRNALLHSKGVVNARILAEYSNISSFTPQDIDVQEVPEVFGGSLDSPLQYSLRGIVGFSQILRKIIAVLDAEFIQSEKAEAYFIQSIRQAMKQRRYGKVESKQVKKLVKSIAFTHFYAEPHKPAQMYSFLQNNGIIGK